MRESLFNLSDPTRLNDEQFAKEVINFFFVIIRLHYKYEYTGDGDAMLISEIKKDFLERSENDFNNMVVWFCDPRFTNILILLEVYSGYPHKRESFAQKIIKSYCLGDQLQITQYLYEDITHTCHQLWMSLIESKNSILNIMIGRSITNSLGLSHVGLRNLKEIISEEMKTYRYCSKKYNTLHFIPQLNIQIFMLLKFLENSNIDVARLIMCYLVQLNLKIIQLEFSEKVLINFINYKVNDPDLKVMNFSIYLVDRKSDYERKNKNKFSYRAFMRDLFFNDPGLFMVIHDDNLHNFLKAFFSACLTMLSSLANKENHEVIMIHEGGMNNVIDIFKGAKKALTQILGEQKNLDLFSIFESLEVCAEVLANVFGEQLKLRKNSNKALIEKVCSDSMQIEENNGWEENTNIVLAEKSILNASQAQDNNESIHADLCSDSQLLIEVHQLNMMENHLTDLIKNNQSGKDLGNKRAEKELQELPQKILEKEEQIALEARKLEANIQKDFSEKEKLELPVQGEAKTNLFKSARGNDSGESSSDEDHCDKGFSK